MGSTQHNKNNNAVCDQASIEKISMLEMTADGTSAAILESSLEIFSETCSLMLRRKGAVLPR